MSNDTIAETVDLSPRLIVSDAAGAIDFYADAFEAVEVERATHADKIVHAKLRIENATFMLKDEEPGTPDVGPADLAGSPVILTLTVKDLDTVGERLEQAGATVIYPIDDRGYGRMGRYRDPFGHVWIVVQE